MSGQTPETTRDDASAAPREHQARSHARDLDALRIGTRGSDLARWQANWVADALRAAHPGLRVEIVEIKTRGDRDRATSLTQMGGQGVFTKEIQRALLDGSVDLAVHSLKDLPTMAVAGLTLAAVPPREDPRDALIAPAARTLDALPAGARIGTSSPRRRALLLANRPDARVVELRGNVETRLRQALEGTLDAVVLAAAGLSRLGLSEHVTETLAAPRFLPAVGQGALGLECRDDDDVTRARVRALDHPATHAAVIAERALLEALQGGCLAPLAAWARVEAPHADASSTRLTLSAILLSPDGARQLEATVVGTIDDPRAAGLEAARDLFARGARELLAAETA